MKLKRYGLLAALIALHSECIAQVGLLNPQYGSSLGFSTHQPGSSRFQDMVSDGSKTLAAGTACQGVQCQLLVIRYDQQGKPDVTFGTQGIVHLRAPTAMALTKPVQIAASEQRYFVLAYSDHYLLWSLHKDGQIDEAFGHGGAVRIEMALDGFPAKEFRTTPGGFVWVGSGLAAPGVTAAAVVYRNTSGAADTTVSSDGIVWSELPERYVGERWTDFVFDAQARLVLAGRAFDTEKARTVALMTRLTTSAQSDPTFASNGLLIESSDQHMFGRNVEIDGFGRIYFSGSECATTAIESCRAFAWRLSANGGPDLRWNAGKPARIGLEGDGFASLNSVLDASGRLLSVGVKNQQATVVRFSAFGQADTAFAVLGSAPLSFQSAHSDLASVLINSVTGQLLVAGTRFERSLEDADAVIAHLLD